MFPPRQRSPHRRVAAALVVSLAAIGSLVLSRASNAPAAQTAQIAPTSIPLNLYDATPSAPTALAPGLAALSEELGDLTERAMASVVSISVQVPVSPGQGPMHPFGFQFGPGPSQPQARPFREGQGSGVVVGTDGLVLTNNHVVADASEVLVTLPDGSRHDATVVGTDPATDLAVVRLDDPPADLVPLPFGDSDAVRPGELCMAIGNPFGLSGSASLGIVSATGRAGMGITDYEDFIQTDTAINPGNSGGALIDAHGRLIGINTAIFSRSGGSQGIGFAIPSNMAREVMAELVENGAVSRGWLGVGIAAAPPKVIEALDLDRGGVLIASVEPGSPAEAAGLRRGDVVTALDGVPMTDVDVLRYRVADLGPGHRARLDVVRPDGRARVDVNLGERPVVARRR